MWGGRQEICVSAWRGARLPDIRRRVGSDRSRGPVGSPCCT